MQILVNQEVFTAGMKRTGIERRKFIKSLAALPIAASLEAASSDGMIYRETRDHWRARIRHLWHVDFAIHLRRQAT